MGSMSWRSGAWVVLLAVVLMPRMAAAEKDKAPRATLNASVRRAPDPSEASDEQKREAQAHFERARRHFDAREFEAALEQFTLAQSVVTSPNTRLYEARCLVELGRLADAYRALSDVVASVSEMGDGAKRYAKTREAARTEQADLARRLAFVHVTAHNTTTATRLFINGREIPRAAWSLPVAATPGSIEVALRTPNGTQHRKRVLVAAGRTREVVLDLGARSK